MPVVGPLSTNAVVTWTTEYYGLADTEMRAQGRQVEDEILAHISPAHSENVNFFGTIAVDIQHELAKLDSSGCRPMRERNSASASIFSEVRRTARRPSLPPAGWPGYRLR